MSHSDLDIDRQNAERQTTMITVTTRTPSGKLRTVNVSRMREAGKVVAYTLADNTGMTRTDATAIAMHAERTGTVTSNGYVFTITKGAPR